MNYDQAVIKSNPYFKLLDELDLAKLLQQITILKLQPKDVLFHEGDFSDAFYIVKEGAIQITTLNARGELIFLARIGTNSFFGEQAFSLSSSPRRRATATAQIETTLYKFPREALLSLKLISPQFQTLLQEKGSQYLKEKLQKLANSFQRFPENFAELIKNDKFFPSRSILFYQDDPANAAYVLIHGEVELRKYNKDKKLQQIVNIGPGQMFGNEGLNSHNIYTSSAITKLDSTVIRIDAKQYHQICQQYPLLKNLGDHFNSQFNFQTKGKIIQFHSEYLDMPATTSIISLNSGQEIICQQVSTLNIFLATAPKRAINREIKYKRDEYYHRSLLLDDNNKIVEILEYGVWTDSSELLDLMVSGIQLSSEQINEFIETGHFLFKDADKTKNEIICKCMCVTQNEINNLIVSEKANFEEISKRTGAGTVCGGCKPTILEMLGMNVWETCVITNTIEHSSEVRSFQLTPLQGHILPYQPGQYLVIKTKIQGVWVQRNYTLTSTPDKPYYEITVKQESKGLFSSWLFNNDNKEEIFYIAGPYGKFTIANTQNLPIVCFMGGIGITPAIAFVRYFAKTNLSQPIYIDYSASRAEQFILTNEFTEIEKQHQNIVINHRITNIHGILTEDEIQNIISSMDKCHVYVCGPKGLENLIIATVNKMNLVPERLHVEQFIHAGAPETISQTISL